MKAWVGIDPGKQGCIFVQFENGNYVYKKIPLIGKEVDVHQLNLLISELKDYDTQVVMEDVHALFNSSAKSTWSFAHTNGLLEGILVANTLPFVKIAPKKWQSVCFEGVPEIRKPGTLKKSKTGENKTIKGKVDTKAMSLLASKRLYPNISLRATERSRVDDDNISDALLLSHYCKLKYK